MTVLMMRLNLDPSDSSLNQRVTESAAAPRLLQCDGGKLDSLLRATKTHLTAFVVFLRFASRVDLYAGHVYKFIPCAHNSRTWARACAGARWLLFALPSTVPPPVSWGSSASVSQ